MWQSQQFRKRRVFRYRAAVLAAPAEVAQADHRADPEHTRGITDEEERSRQVQPQSINVDAFPERQGERWETDHRMLKN